MITKLDIGDGCARYELAEDCSKKSHHHHLICSACRKIIDYSDFIDDEKEYIHKIEKELEKRHNFNINHHVIQFYGKCISCSKKEENL